MVKEEVDEDDIAAVVSAWTGIPVSRLLEGEVEKLIHMEERLHQRVVGQSQAVEAVANALRRARSGLQDPNRPIGSFIFLGPTGVGKTELARALAEFMFDDERAMVRLDMSEYQERHTVARLVGAPPGYVGYEEGGQLTEAVRRRPYTVVLLDEIEKAHTEVFDVLLQLLDDGRLTDGQGRTVDFRNTVIIMTSNIRSPNELRDRFRPEFLNRVDEVVAFEALTREQLADIVELQLARLRERLAERRLSLEVTDAAKELLAEEGWDPAYGARPLKRAIQRLVENPLALELLEGRFAEGDTVRVDAARRRARVRARRRCGHRFRLGNVLEEVGALAHGRGAVDEEDELRVARVPQLKNRLRLHDENAAPLQLVALGRLPEVDGQCAVEHDEDFLLRPVCMALAARTRRIAPDVRSRLRHRVGETDDRASAARRPAAATRARTRGRS